MRASEIKEKYVMQGQPQILSQVFFDLVDFVIENYKGFCYSGKDGSIGLTVDEIKERYKSDSQPEVMNQMFYEVIDFIIDNYDGFSHLEELAVEYEFSERLKSLFDYTDGKGVAFEVGTLVDYCGELERQIDRLVGEKK